MQVDIEVTEAQLELLVSANNELRLAQVGLNAVTKTIVCGTEHGRKSWRLSGINVDSKSISIGIDDIPEAESAAPVDKIKLEK